MIRGIIYLTGLFTLTVVGLVLAVAFQVHRWPWADYISQGREEIVRLLDDGSGRGRERAEAPMVPFDDRRVVIERPDSFEFTGPPTVLRHTVSHGETLYSIARRYYGNGESWPLIASANDIRRPADLRAGRVLVIPHDFHPHGLQARVPDLRIGFAPAGKR